MNYNLNVQKKHIIIKYFGLIFFMILIAGISINIHYINERNAIKAKVASKRLTGNQKKIYQAVLGDGHSKYIPVLMYHSIKYEKGNVFRLPKDKFLEQMEYLKKNNFHPISMDELYSYIVYNTNLPKKPVVITFDDGYEDNYTNAYPILKKFGFKATIFMISENINHKGCLSESELIELDKNGIDIESHTVSHSHLTKLPLNLQEMELQTSKNDLEGILDKHVKYISYPYGDYNEEVQELVQKSGYTMAFTTRLGEANKSQGIYKLKRYFVGDYGMFIFKKIVN